MYYCVVARLYATVGVHPTRCAEFESEAYTADEHMEKLLRLIIENREKVVAIGECGLGR